MGKHKYIKTPEALYTLFEKYKEFKRANPRIIEKALQSGKVSVERMQVPLTLSGFYVFGYDNNVTLDHYFNNSEDAYDEYRVICSRIKREIRTDQIEGGMTGQFNASITQRLNGLQESTKVEITKEPRVFNINIDNNAE